MEPKSEISFIHPNEIEEAKIRMMHVRFDCLVRMFDCSKIRGGKPLPPQWFKSEIKLTMELIEYSDPYVLGKIIKDAFFELKYHIERYESNNHPH